MRVHSGCGSRATRVLMVMDASGTVISDVGRKYLRLQLTTDVGPIRLRNLLDHFGSVDAVLAASRGDLERVRGIAGRVSEGIFRARNDNAAEREIDRAAHFGLRIVCLEDPDYPKPLLNIPDPPTCLYIRGQLRPADAVAVAIVGTRRCSHYGREQAVRFGELLGHAGFTVVSGLARGVDGHAHRGALRAGGRTVAVLGNGLGSVYPREHESLAAEVAEAGAVLSEFPVETSPAPENFPRRNRIIAGLSLGVIVAEAGKQSGALITARLANEYNREVFAVPGRVDQPELTLGTSGLIRDGQAKLVTGLDDVLDELGNVGEVMRTSAPPAPLTPDHQDAAMMVAAALTLTTEERAVLDAVTKGTEDADAICLETQLDIGRVTPVLTSLQLKGLVKRLPGGCFARRTAKRVP